MNKNSLKLKLITYLDIMFHFLPVSKNRIFFCSFYGQYNDNPKYISEELHKLDNKLDIVWVTSEKMREKYIPPYISKVRYNTIRYIYEKNRAKVIVDNGAGIYFMKTNPRLAFLQRKLKNKKQLNISTWHGTPLKKIGADIPEINLSKDTLFTTSDMIIAGCEYTKSIFNKAFLHKIPVYLTGTPRNDILFNTSTDLKIKLREKLNLPKDKKIILYAPTFRYDINNSGVNQMKEMDIKRILDVLSAKFGGEWVFVFRVHQMVLLNIDTESISKKYGDKVINGNQYDDMAEYLAASDALITDYSGSLFDFALTKKPCFLYTPDKENYEKKERGLYLDMNILPYTYALSNDELIKQINEFDEKLYKNKINNFLEYIGNIEDGKAANRIANIIINYVRTNKLPKN